MANLNRLEEICVVLEESTEYLLHGANSASVDYMRNEITEMLEGCSAETIKLIAKIIKPIVESREK